MAGWCREGSRETGLGDTPTCRGAIGQQLGDGRPRTWQRFLASYRSPTLHVHKCVVQHFTWVWDVSSICICLTPPYFITYPEVTYLKTFLNNVKKPKEGPLGCPW